MAGLVPLPETVVHSSTRLTHLQAHTLLSNFLQEADVNPAYRPDAVLTQHGPQAAGVGSQSNLTLNHLDRILKGIAGKRIGGIEFDYGEGPAKKRRRVNGDAAFTSSPPVAATGQNVAHAGEEVVEMEEADGISEAAVVGHETDDWQDKEQFEHSQIDETVDQGERNMADAGSTRADEVVDGTEGGSVVGQTMTLTEKEARKLAKSQRRRKERQEKNAAVKGTKS